MSIAERETENARRLEIARTLLVAAEARAAVRRTLPAKLRAFPFNLVAPPSRVILRVLSYALKDHRIAIDALIRAARECLSVLVDVRARLDALGEPDAGSRDIGEFVQLLGAHQRIVNAVLDGLGRELADAKAEHAAEIARLETLVAQAELRLAAIESGRSNGVPAAASMRTHDDAKVDACSEN
jgi:hypothetical protein